MGAGQMKVFRQMVRGLGSLPYVGSHPGVPVYFCMVFLSGFALYTVGGGWTQSLILSGMVAATYGSVLLWGSYDRANLSDSLVGAAHGEFNKDRSNS